MDRNVFLQMFVTWWLKMCFFRKNRLIEFLHKNESGVKSEFHFFLNRIYTNIRKLRFYSI